MPGGFIGAPGGGTQKTRGSESKGIKPSSKIKLIEGEVPKYKGDVEIDLNGDGTEPISVLVMSGPGLGKSTFGLTFPNVAMCDTEMKGEDIWRKFYRGEIESYRQNSDGVVEPYHWDTKEITPSNSRLMHAANWGEVSAFYDHFSKEPGIDTLMFDSETDLREMAELWTLKETGKSTLYKVGGSDTRVNYSLCYGKLRYILYYTKMNGKNLVYTARVKDEYIDGKNTGKKIHDGYTKQAFYTQYVIHLQIGIHNSSGEHIFKKHVFGKVLKCGTIRPTMYPPFLIDCSYRGVINELVKGEPFDGTLDDYIREVVAPRMKVLEVRRD